MMCPVVESHGGARRFPLRTASTVALLLALLVTAARALDDPRHRPRPGAPAAQGARRRGQPGAHQCDRGDPGRAGRTGRHPAGDARVADRLRAVGCGHRRGGARAHQLRVVAAPGIRVRRPRSRGRRPARRAGHHRHPRQLVAAGAARHPHGPDPRHGDRAVPRFRARAAGRSGGDGALPGVRAGTGVAAPPGGHRAVRRAGRCALQHADGPAEAAARLHDPRPAAARRHHRPAAARRRQRVAALGEGAAAAGRQRRRRRALAGARRRHPGVAADRDRHRDRGQPARRRAGALCR